jgi:F0F1-type ATP synthase membrane subunit c/vacuolar-type H+-ATPase subunit K
MKYEKVFNKPTDSLILSLENLTTEYNNVLNTYNQVQQELDTFANSQWTINPYLNQNIQFTTGEIAYVTISGSVYLYEFIPGLQNTISSDQVTVGNNQNIVNSEQNVVNQAQSAYNTAYNNSIAGQMGNFFQRLFEGFTTVREPYKNQAPIKTIVNGVPVVSSKNSNAVNSGNNSKINNGINTLLFGGYTNQYSNQVNSQSSQSSQSSQYNYQANNGTSNAPTGSGSGSGSGSGLQMAQNTVLNGTFGTPAAPPENVFYIAANDVAGAVDTVYSGATTLLSGGYDSTIDSGLNTAVSDVTNAFDTAGSDITNAFDTAGSDMNNAFNTAGSDISNAFNSVGNSISNEFGGNLPQLQSELSQDQSALRTDQSNLASSVNSLNLANANYQNALNLLIQSGCPATSNVIQVNLPWLAEYSQPYNLIPTQPPLLTMGTFTYNNEQIGYYDAYNPQGVLGQGCNNINSQLTPPPYDIINIYNTTYSGTPIMTLPNTTIEVCRASCYSTAHCSGATFNSQTNTCSLESGAGTLQPTTTPGVTALIPQVTQYLLILAQLNFQLTDINDQIINITKTGQTDIDKYTNDNTIDHKFLKNRYTKLVEEGKIIDSMITSIENSQNEEISESVSTNTNYLKYILLTALVIIFCIILGIISKNNQNAATADGTVQKSLFFIIFIVAIIVLGVFILQKFVTGTPT